MKIYEIIAGFFNLMLNINDQDKKSGDIIDEILDELFYMYKHTKAKEDDSNPKKITRIAVITNNK